MCGKKSEREIQSFWSKQLEYAEMGNAGRNRIVEG